METKFCYGKASSRGLAFTSAFHSRADAYGAGLKEACATVHLWQSKPAPQGLRQGGASTLARLIGALVPEFCKYFNIARLHIDVFRL